MSRINSSHCISFTSAAIGSVCDRLAEGIGAAGVAPLFGCSFQQKVCHEMGSFPSPTRGEGENNIYLGDTPKPQAGRALHPLGKWGVSGDTPKPQAGRALHPLGKWGVSGDTPK